MTTPDEVTPKIELVYTEHAMQAAMDIGQEKFDALIAERDAALTKVAELKIDYKLEREVLAADIGNLQQQNQTLREALKEVASRYNSTTAWNALAATAPDETGEET